MNHARVSNSPAHVLDTAPRCLPNRHIPPSFSSFSLPMCPPGPKRSTVPTRHSFPHLLQCFADNPQQEKNLDYSFSVGEDTIAVQAIASLQAIPIQKFSSYRVVARVLTFILLCKSVGAVTCCLLAIYDNDLIICRTAGFSTGRRIR